jgi:hypothetical protein
MEIGESFFGKNHEKLSHWRNLAPKIIYDDIIGREKSISINVINKST